MYKEIVVEDKSIGKDMRNLVPISAQELKEKFGSKSHIYLDIKENLESLWKEVKDNPDMKVTMDNWANAIGTLYGYNPDISLFLDHTYLGILAKIVVYFKFEHSPNRNEIFDVISGKYFTAKGISNFLENDVSFWLLSPEIKDKSFILFCMIFEALENYDFSKIDEDVFKEIYEEIIERDERHKAGEYYTPEWLVQLILNDVLALWEGRKGSSIPKILDPACGSGTFLYRAIRYLVGKKVSLRGIIKNVAGIDINPIATTIAKANYLIAISDLIEDSEEITLPIYTKDCLKSPDLFDYDVKIEKYDMIIGNPPWVVMRSMKNKEYQNFLKKEVLNYHLLENKDVHLFTQMELATLFFCRCADLYIGKGGIIAFVMPRSVLAGTIHHINFRKFRNPPLRLIKIIDLEDVTPLFNMPSCVLIGTKDGMTKYPVPLERYNGELLKRNGTFSEVQAKLSLKVCEYTPPDFLLKPSYYHDKFKVGASIFPRSLYFVDFISRSAKSSELAIRTSKEIYEIVKAPWQIELNGNIESDFIYATLLAWEMFSFGYVRLRPVVLPIKESSHGYRLISIDNVEWFKNAQKIWDERKTKKSEKRFPSVLDRLNYNGLLTVQKPSVRYVVLYNATGTNLVSCVIDKRSLPYFEFNGRKIAPRGFVADVKTWFFETENMKEAYYLCAIFNSEIISKIIKPLQPRGLFGARAIHRRPLLFPIPQFNGSDCMHIKLADIAKRCHDKINAIRFKQRNNIRREARKRFINEIAEIDEIVSEIIEIKEEGRQNARGCQNVGKHT
jgi:type I restriction-modification system DNA methylase subunit